MVISHAQVEFVDNGRIEAAFRKYFHRASPRQHKDSYEIFVLHGNVIRYFTCRYLREKHCIIKGVWIFVLTVEQLFTLFPWSSCT